MFWKEWEEILCAALREMDGAIKELKKDMAPVAPMPRPRYFHITPNIIWPHCSPRHLNWGATFDKKRNEENSICSWERYNRLARLIIDECGGQPRLILRALRRIQAATAWCEARAEGRKKMAQEILRQQAKAVEALEAEAALQALK